MGKVKALKQSSTPKKAVGATTTKERKHITFDDDNDSSEQVPIVNDLEVSAAATSSSRHDSTFEADDNEDEMPDVVTSSDVSLQELRMLHSQVSDPSSKKKKKKEKQRKSKVDDDEQLDISALKSLENFDSQISSKDEVEPENEVIFRINKNAIKSKKIKHFEITALDSEPTETPLALSSLSSFPVSTSANDFLNLRFNSKPRIKTSSFNSMKKVAPCKVFKNASNME